MMSGTGSGARSRSPPVPPWSPFELPAPLPSGDEEPVEGLRGSRSRPAPPRRPSSSWAGPDGVREKGGKKLEVSFPIVSDRATIKARATALAQMMKNIGVKLNIDARPSADFNKIITDRSFDIFGLGFTSSDPNGMLYICQVYCSDSQLNLSRSVPKSMDKEIQAVTNLPTLDEQLKTGEEVEKKAMETYGIMPTHNGPTIWAVKKGLTNYGAGQFFGNYGVIGPPELIGWQKK